MIFGVIYLRYEIYVCSMACFSYLNNNKYLVLMLVLYYCVKIVYGIVICK